MPASHLPGSAPPPTRLSRGTDAIRGALRRAGAGVRHGRGGAVRSYQALLASWPVRGYNEAGAGHLSAILAYNSLVALVPTTLLLVSVAGLLLRQDAVMTTFVRSAYWALPGEDARQALEAALAARSKSGWFALASLVGFIWIGSGFAGALNHCFNCVYGVPDGNFIATRRRGLAVLSAFIALFTAVTVAATLPALFIRRDAGPYFSTWALAGTRGQIVSYALAFVAAALSFLLIYRLTPNAGQRLHDVWPGAVVAGALFVALGQAFPTVFAPDRRREPLRRRVWTADVAPGMVCRPRAYPALRVLRERDLPTPSRILAARGHMRTLVTTAQMSTRMLSNLQAGVAATVVSEGGSI